MRVKKGKHAIKRRRNILKRTKGYRQGRKSKERIAREAIVHAGKHAFAHRRDKKNDFRRLWTARINAELKKHGLSYSRFISALKKKGIEVDRKILAGLAKDNPKSFERLVKKV